MPETTAQLDASPAAQFLAELTGVLATVSSVELDRLVDLLLETRARGKRVYVIGNGGSAATASHFANDLAKTAMVAGFAPIRAFSLTDNAPLLTAWANDVSFERVFAAQLEGLIERDDVVIAITASGNSPNIVLALQTANNCGARTAGLLGFNGGAALDLVDVPVHIVNRDYGVVEAGHLAICHAVSTAIRRRLLTDLPA